MKYNILGNSNLKISVISFGSWATGGWMWGGADTRASIRAIQSSYEHGVTTFDTAPIYGMGFSEEVLAKALGGYPRDSYQILTKFGLNWWDTQGEYYFESKDNDGNPITIYRNARKEAIIKECEDSLKRLKTDYIDLYQIHRPDSTTPINETFEAVYKLIKEGKVRYAGVSNYTVDQCEQALKSCLIVSNQVPYSMLERQIEQDIIPYSVSKNIGILAYSPLQRGFLTGKINTNRKFGEGDHRQDSIYYKPHNLKAINDFLNAIKPISLTKQCSLSQLVLAWTMRQKGITSLLVGARDENQALENLHAVDVKLNDEDILFINKQLSLLKISK
jgi:aryl-alcohol dehydrogenase-like predicted oxidoreductase